MAATYGAERPDTERYRLSFTVGGLLTEQSRIIARLFLEDQSAQDLQSDEASSKTNVELGDRIGVVRQRAIKENVLAIRTQTATSRTVSEVLKRLSALTIKELAALADGDTFAPDCRILMWVAMCRYYAFIGDFAEEVLRERYRIGEMTVTYDEYERFVFSKSMWHSELDGLSEATKQKLRGNLFKAMREADLIEADANTITSPVISPGMHDLLSFRPESFRFLPLRGTF